MKWFKDKFLHSLLILLSITVFSCSKVEQQETSDKLGYDLSVVPTAISDSDRAFIIRICDALEFKDASALVGNDYEFNYSTRSCGAEKFGEVEVTATTVGVESGLHYFFLLGTSTKFQFAKIETETDGVMAEICDGLTSDSTLETPMESTGNYTYFTSYGIPSSECPVVADEQCMYFQRGEASSEDGYATITEREWVRFRINTDLDKPGFFTYRKLTSKSDCADDKSRGRMATLN